MISKYLQYREKQKLIPYSSSNKNIIHAQMHINGVILLNYKEALLSLFGPQRM